MSWNGRVKHSCWVASFVFAVPASAAAPLDLAVRAALEIPESHATPSFVSATVDLNGDGVADRLVVITDLSYCGSGGCTLLVFEGTSSGMRFISKSTLTAPPIRVSHKAKLGWKSLIVNSGGTGSVVLDFNGVRYPLNPSLERRADATDISEADVVISGYGR